MSRKKSSFIAALGESESRRDGGFKQSWSDTLVTMERVSGQQEVPTEGGESSPVKHSSVNGFAETRERQIKPLHRSVKMSDSTHSLRVTPLGPRTSFVIMNPTVSQTVMVQGRIFQHAQFSPPVRKLEQRSDVIQREELDNIVLTCPEISDSDGLKIKRRAQQKRRMSSTVSKAAESLRPGDYLTVCGSCGQGSEDHAKCDHCGNVLPIETVALPAISSALPPRPPICPKPAPATQRLQVSKGFYQCSQQLGLRVSSPVRITPINILLPQNGQAVAASVGFMCNGLKQSGGAKLQISKPCHLSDPIVLSSDEDEDSDNLSSSGIGNQLDSVSPRPGDSAHSSPAPSGGRGEAMVKAAGVQEDPALSSPARCVATGPAGEIEDHSCDFFVQRRSAKPRKTLMRDELGNFVVEDPTLSKKVKLELSRKLSSIILDCRSVRIGTLRRMLTKPVVFTLDFIQLETEGSEMGELETITLETSALTQCEWCNVKKLPVLFLQTTERECQRLQTQLQMSQERGVWYDCNGNNDEKYIALIFEHSPLKEQIILEDILQEIGRNNNKGDFPLKIGFDEANIRLVNYSKAFQKKEKVFDEKMAASAAPMTSAQNVSLDAVATASSALSSSVPATCSTSGVRGSMPADFTPEEDEDMTDLQPTFTGPVIKLFVYPPPPAKGGISVTNEDLHCLNDGEFLNDVIIDFYLKYLFLEKLKKEDAMRSHVFSSFFYKRLNQRERRTGVDTSSIPIQKRKHNRVKTWTRHVDLFQKDFIFVPINESAHWYLAVICFPGLECPQLEPNPLYQPQTSLQSAGGSSNQSFESEELESFKQHTTSSLRPASETNKPQITDGVHRIMECYGKEDSNQSEQSFSPDECSEDGTFFDDCASSERAEWTSRPTLCKQPCILIMDSLGGPSRSTVVKTLREYLEVEWEVKKGSKRSFGKDLMKGSSPRVPQQDNFSDCGVYVLQYVESFFENPLPSFHLPMSLLDWFPQQRMKTKRLEICNLIRNIQMHQNLNTENSELSNADTSPLDETANLIPPISP
ncbi:hypothetical protein DNTS_032401 [Danionella cerebrum]|uniref:Ubiquitin-like protease family profile domain-containing protein n=1 Tax=Danionella cerebrum TaxID=2873325 RepID=A0A553N148_9TELE|nr:hypothetical protein DNTS_032401 [Danionella translucida]